MGTTKVILDFSPNRYSDLRIITKAGIIQEKMTGNEHFPTPEPPLPTLNIARAGFLAAYNKSVDESKEDTLLKNTARVELENILRQVGQYIQSASYGQEATILSSGFDMRKKAEPIGPLEQAMGLVVRYGINSGKVTMECNVIKNAVMYNFEYTDASIVPDTHWISNMTTKRQINLNGLTSGKYYEFRVAGMNSDPSRNWSEPVSKLVV